MSVMDEALRGLSQQLFALIDPMHIHVIEPTVIPGKKPDGIIAGDISLEGGHASVVGRVIYSCLKNCTESTVQKNNGIGRTTTITYSFPTTQRMGEAFSHICEFADSLKKNESVKKNVLQVMQTAELIDSLGATNAVPYINLRYGMPEISLRINTVDRDLAMKLRKSLAADIKLTKATEVWSDRDHRTHCGGFHCLIENDQIKDLAEIVGRYKQERSQGRGQ